MNVKTKVIALAAGALATAGLAAGVAGSFLASCATTPANVPVQTFEQPQNMDVLCMHVLEVDGGPIIPAVPFPEAACAQVPTNVVGGSLPFHLFALVTQMTRGEVAVVDLTAGAIVDVDPNTPGVNFLPVGRLPSDIATSPDGQMVFVGSADPNSPAIFALPSTVILGNAQAFDGGTTDPGFTQVPIPQLTTWPVCALPQTPGAIRVLPNALLPPLPDGGAPAGSSAGYVVVAVLPGNAATSAKVVTIDPAPLLRGAGGYVDAGVTEDGGTVDRPGALTTCSLLEGENPLVLGPGPGAPPTGPGPAWDDGVKYVDGGVVTDLPTSAVACVNAVDAGVGGGPATGAKAGGGATALDTSGSRPLLYVADTGLPIIHVIDLSDPVAPKELEPLLATNLAAPARNITFGQIAVSPTTREYKRFLYAVDRTQGSLVVFDVTDPATSPHVPLTRPHQELDPFQPPDRILFSAPVASVAFVRHDWPLTQKYTSGSSATALTAAETGLLCNPNHYVNGTMIGNVPAEQGPFNDDGAYYRNGNTVPAETLNPFRLRGVFAFATLSNGSVIAIDVDDWDAPCRRPDPLAARGTQGSEIVDGGVGLAVAEALVEGPFSAIAPPQFSNGPTDTDPYHTPIAFDQDLPSGAAYTDSPVSLEWFYPVSAPHRPRSAYFLRNDPINGQHAPFLLATPQLFASGASLATNGPQAVLNPSMVPTVTEFVDPSAVANPTAPDPALRTPAFTPILDGGAEGGLDDITLVQTMPLQTPGVRFAWEDPEVQQNQDWAVTFEGPLPGFFDNGGNPLVVANVVAFNQLPIAGVSPSGGGANYDAVWLTSRGTFCAKGIEDFSLGTQRADADVAALAALSVPVTTPDGGVETNDGGVVMSLPTMIPNYDRQVADYIQLTDNLAPATDPYWTVQNSCWEPADPTDFSNPKYQGNASANVAQRASAYYSFCSGAFGTTLVPASPNPQRDFPIILAYDDQLLIGRFEYQSALGPSGTVRAPGSPSWAILGPDPSNDQVLAAMQCCFHNQVHFNVRTGGQWSAAGSASGFLHHIVPTGTDGRCAPSCDGRDALLNGRAAPIPHPACGFAGVPPITRDNVLAMRNPMFSFLIWDGQDTTSGCTDVPPVRDMTWAFSTRGQFTPIALNLAGNSPGLSPQSMRFIDSLGQLAIIDGSSQGLILIDLNSIAEAHPPYY